MHKLFSFPLLFLLLTQWAPAGAGVITGTVQESESHKYLAGVIVTVQDTDISDKTDSGGAFLLRNLKPGTYYIRFMKKGYYSLIIPDVKIKDEKPLLLKTEMYPGDETQFLFLEIGGIQVTAERELLSEEPETVHTINSGEIEHMQANSLADALTMIPGNENAGGLGLNKRQSINLRSFSEDQASAFGTKVIVDDVPLTNNANLNTGVGVGLGVSVSNNSGWGYDLREIAAENLDKIEVSAGASSVEYGDHTTGLIKVKTKIKNVPTRLKLKNNPDTREANLMGSFNAGRTNFVYNLNYGYSERDIRIEGDEFHRISASLKSQNYFFNNRLDLRNSIKYSRKIEENNYRIDTSATKAYNRDHHFTYSQQFNFKWNKVTKLYWRNYVDYQRRNSWKNQLETADVAYLTNRMTGGAAEAIISYPIYRSDVRTIGDEWSYGSKLKIQRKLLTGEILHRFLGGAEFQTDRNLGRGKTFDILRPPYGHLTSRPRSFDAIPGVTQLALFFEDRVTGTLLFPFTLDLGFRLDSYNPTRFKAGNLFQNKDIFEAKQGTFFNPRIGLKVKPFPKTQLRFTYSKSSKTPALNSIYPENYFLDVSEIGLRNGQVGDTVHIVSTHVFDRSAPNLKGYQSTKYEIGLDQQVGNFGLSLAAYYNVSKNQPKSVYNPFYYDFYFWPQWPEKSGRESVEQVLASTSYKKSINRSWSKNSGFEFSLRSHRIPSLNMRFRVSAAFNYRKSGSDAYPVYTPSRKIISADMDTLLVAPYYAPNESWRQRMVVKYNVDYIAKPLGIWLTFRAEQKLFEQSVQISKVKLAADGYFYNGQNYDIDAETSAAIGLDRSAPGSEYTTVNASRPNDIWLFSVTASKALFKGAEVSLFVNNIFNNLAYYKDIYGLLRAGNPAMFWGIAFSSKLDNLFK